MNKTTKTILIVAGIIFLAVIANQVFYIPVSYIFLFGIILACPLLHLWMMGSGGHKHG